MKIAYIAVKGMPLGGGIERYTEELGSRLAARGHEVVVYAMRHYGASDGLYKGMKIRTVPALNMRAFEKLSAAALAALAATAGKRMDIVHFHAFGPAMFCIIPRLFGRRVVVQGHGIEWKRSRWGPAGRLFLMLSEMPSVRLPHAVCVVSETLKNYLWDTYERECVCIPSGAAPAGPRPPSLIRRLGLAGDDYILFAARLVREKGAHYLMEAFRELKNKNGLKLKLVIAGDAPHEDAYKSMLRRMAKGEPGIIFPGFVTGGLLEELYSNCYLFVLPSEVEGLSVALLEAMGYGNCCLASDIPENVEAMGGNGYTFRSRDPRDLALKLSSLAAEPLMVRRMKERARVHVMENHSWDAITDRFERLYRSVISGRRLEPGIQTDKHVLEK